MAVKRTDLTEAEAREIQRLLAETQRASNPNLA